MTKRNSICNRIGTVEVLHTRIYTNKRGGEVAVSPGHYPVYSTGNMIYFEMGGRKSTRIAPVITRIPEMENTFSVQPGYDQLSKQRTRIRRSFSQAEFEDLISDPVATEGHPDQRLRFDLSEDSKSKERRYT